MPGGIITINIKMVFSATDSMIHVRLRKRDGGRTQILGNSPGSGQSEIEAIRKPVRCPSRLGRRQRIEGASR